MIVFISVSVLLFALSDIYIWMSFIRGTHHAFLSAAYWLPAAVFMATLAYAYFGHTHNWTVNLFFILFLCIYVPKVIFTLFSLLGRGAGLFIPHLATAGNIAGAILAAVIIAGSAYGFIYGWKQITVRHIDIESPDIPESFDGYRIAQITDLHTGTFSGVPTYIEHLREKINQVNADLIVFTGDIVNSSSDELMQFTGTLSRLNSTDGVFSVLGNHDYCLYQSYDTPDGAAKNLARLKSLEKEMGWNLLLNTHAFIKRENDSIAIIGVENIGRPPFPSRGNLTKATEGIAPGCYKILLSHDPSHWDMEVLPKTDIQLTLSGHTHAMQFRIGRLSPSRWFYKRWAGLYETDGQKLYVSTGAGGNLLFRFGAWPEICVFTLHHSPAGKSSEAITSGK